VLLGALIRSLLVRVVEPAGNQREGGSTLAVRSSRGEPKTRGRTQQERDEDREDARMRQETQGENKKSARATRWKTRGDLLLCLGVARVHLISDSEKCGRHNSETKPLPLRSSGTSTLLRFNPTSCDVSLRCCDVSLRCCDVSLRCCDVSLRRCDVSSRCSDASYSGS